MNLKDLHFTDVAEIQVAVNDELKKVQKDKISNTQLALYADDTAILAQS
jgi:hypothetical protein